MCLAADRSGDVADRETIELLALRDLLILPGPVRAGGETVGLAPPDPDAVKLPVFLAALAGIAIFNDGFGAVASGDEPAGRILQVAAVLARQRLLAARIVAFGVGALESQGRPGLTTVAALLDHVGNGRLQRCQFLIELDLEAAIALPLLRLCIANNSENGNDQQQSRPDKTISKQAVHRTILPRCLQILSLNWRNLSVDCITF
ncbi:MAG: hypothetical protein RQ729_11175 [Wenzhouxiangellaceae bacterium]|nr:hypothetical protein [Wenzhouxiangellaceae bacterium]